VKVLRFLLARYCQLTVAQPRAGMLNWSTVPPTLTVVALAEVPEL
jgi:hypothetical protein